MAELPLEAKETGLDPQEGLVPQEPEDDVVAKTATSLPDQIANEASQDVVVLRDRYLIYTNRPLPEFDSDSARAFIAEDRQNSGHQYYALICTPGLPIRLNSIKLVRNGNLRNCLPLADWDTVYWPPLNQKTVIVVFSRPLGGKLLDRLARKQLKITEYDLPSRVIAPLAEALQSFSDNNQTYRALSPKNIMFLDHEMKQIVLGPNVTAPPGYDQQLIFEPLDRAMAQRNGRGLGDSSDDIYALGINIILIFLGYNPVAKMNDEDLIKRRLENGSYNTICGNENIPVRLIEPLRGMLADDPNERWTFSEINNWLTGQTINSVKRKPNKKSEISFQFRGQAFFNPRLLALQFTHFPTDAIKAIKSDQFITWLGRGLKQPQEAHAIHGAIQNAKFYSDSYQGADDYLIARVIAILDPFGPIRYKGLAFMPDGYGTMLASEWIRNNNAQPIADVLSHDVTSFWLNALPDEYATTRDIGDSLARLRGLLSIQDPGYGLERVLYESNPGIACQSPFVIKEGVVLIEQLLPALDHAANDTDTSSQPIDRHIAGFIAARFNEDIHPHLKAMASKKPDTSVIGTLSLLAFLQWKLRVPAVLALSSWIGGLLGPAINAYRNRHTRLELERLIPRLVRKGSLPELFNLIDNQEKRREDAHGFSNASAEWLQAETEIRDIEGKGEARLTKAERSGQQFAAIISVTIALIAIAVLVVTELN